MSPTPKLRFVERQAEVHGDIKLVRVLQQWWSIGLAEIAKNPSRVGDGEWRDVPLEKE